MLCVHITPLPRILPEVHPLSLKLTIPIPSLSKQGIQSASRTAEPQPNQGEKKGYWCKKKKKVKSQDSTVEKYRRASEITPIIISVYDQKLLDSILGSHVKKDTILK